jgi:hypothetical protein
MHYHELAGMEWTVGYGYKGHVGNIAEIPKDAYFIRPDSRAAQLLNLDHDDQAMMFSGDNWWIGENIRDLGKGADVYDLVGAENCNECDYAPSLCEC